MSGSVKHWEKWAFAALLLLAFLVRALPVRYGLPHTYYPDESYAVTRALQLPRDHFKPDQFLYPPLYLYVLLFEYGAMYSIGKVFGYFTTLNDMAYLYLADKTLFYLLGRFTTAIIGVATVVVAKHLGDQVFGRNVGWLSALALAVWPMHVTYSARTLLDVPVTFLVVVAVLAVYRIEEIHSVKNYVLAGVLIGLGIVTKYSPVLLIPFLGIVWLLGWNDARKQRVPGPGLKQLGSAAIAVAGTVFITDPFLFCDWRRAIVDLSEPYTWMYGSAAFGYVGYVAGLVRGIGYPLVAAVAIGLLMVLLRRRRKEVLFLVPPTVYFIVVAKGGHVEMRYIMPVLPFLACLGGVGIIAAVKFVGRRIDGSLVKAAIPAMVLFYPALQTVSGTATLLRTDTRTIANRWIEENLPEGSGVFLEAYGPQLRTSTEEAMKIVTSEDSLPEQEYQSNRRKLRYQLWRRHAASRFYVPPRRGFRIFRRVSYTGATTPTYRIQPPTNGYWSLLALRQMGIEYYVASSRMYERYGGLKDVDSSNKGGYLTADVKSREATTRHEFYHQLTRSATLVKEFRPSRLRYDGAERASIWKPLLGRLSRAPGPVIKIYKLPEKAKPCH